MRRCEKLVAEGGTRQKPGSSLAFKPAFYSTLYRLLTSAWMWDLPFPTHGYLQVCHGVACAVPKYLNSSSHPPQDWEPHTHVHSTIGWLFIPPEMCFGHWRLPVPAQHLAKTFQNPHFQSPTFRMHHLSPQCWVFQSKKIRNNGPSYEIPWTRPTIWQTWDQTLTSLRLQCPKKSWNTQRDVGWEDAVGTVISALHNSTRKQSVCSLPTTNLHKTAVLLITSIKFERKQ